MHIRVSTAFYLRARERERDRHTKRHRQTHRETDRHTEGEFLKNSYVNNEW